MWVYIQTECAGRDGATNNLYTVGFFDPNGNWHSESDHSNKDLAAGRVAYLNGNPLWHAGDAGIGSIEGRHVASE